MSLVAHTIPETLTITGMKFLTMISLRSKILYHIQKTTIAIQIRFNTLATYDKTPKPYNVILVTKTNPSQTLATMLETRKSPAMTAPSVKSDRSWKRKKYLSKNYKIQTKFKNRREPLRWTQFNKLQTRKIINYLHQKILQKEEENPWITHHSWDQLRKRSKIRKNERRLHQQKTKWAFEIMNTTQIHKKDLPQHLLFVVDNISGALFIID